MNYNYALSDSCRTDRGAKHCELARTRKENTEVMSMTILDADRSDNDDNETRRDDFDSSFGFSCLDKSEPGRGSDCGVQVSCSDYYSRRRAEICDKSKSRSKCSGVCSDLATEMIGKMSLMSNSARDHRVIFDGSAVGSANCRRANYYGLAASRTRELGENHGSNEQRYDTDWPKKQAMSGQRKADNCTNKRYEDAKNAHGSTRRTNPTKCHLFLATTPLHYSAIILLFLLLGAPEWPIAPRRPFLATASSPDELFMAAEFVPTRKPQAQPHQAMATAPVVDRKPQASSDPVQAAQTERTTGATKFARINELDVFLDDMNHNELRAVASGSPLPGDPFQPKVLDEPAAKELERKRSGGAEPGNGRRDSSGVQLEGSHSETQIYSECALILQRTYVKNIDDPKHQMIPFGKTEQSCISYKHIDKAVEKAKKQLKFKEMSKKRKKTKLPLLDVIHTTLEPPEDLVAALGEINMATTQIIADQFDLSNDELLNGLPLIDMSKTKFWPMCPRLVRQDIKCELTRFRTITAHCNNLKHPTWGAAMTPFARYLPPVHPDGIWVPRKSIVTEITFQLSQGHRETHTNISPTMPVPVYRERRAGPTTSAGSDPASPSAELKADSSVQFVQHARLDHGEPDQAPVTPPLVHYQQSHKHAAGARSASHSVVESSSSSQVIAMSSQQHEHQHHNQGRSMATELPSARLVTSVVHRDIDLPNHDFSILFMSWGQLLDHDMTRAAQPPASIKCCQLEPGAPRNKLCLPIQVPANDPFYSKFNVRCLEFRRSLAGLRPNCVLGPRVHQNAITSPIDANFVYGSSEAQASALRLFKGGRLRSRDWFQHQHLKPLLPGQEQEPDRDCLGRPRDLLCFLAGDVRVNEQTHLTVLHTLYMRDHNRMAERLEELNPHWPDERLYQETRHIMAATVQHAMINEYLPLLIGTKMADLYNLTAHHHSHHHHHHGKHDVAHYYWHGYDPTVTTSVSNSFAAGAFRQGHTFVQGTVERYNKVHEFVASERLRNLFKRPFLLYQPGVLDELVGGMINQPSQSYDPFITEDISGHLFQPPESLFGHDLPAINLQRGREQGVPGYNLFREWCGLPRAETFDQLEPYLTNNTAYQYSRLYKHVDDIDLWSGGVSERKLPGAAIGPTFACIIARQFSNTRRGDRFWYENPHMPSSFTPAQLAELRKSSLAKLLCTNSDDLPTIQRWALRMPHPVLNPRVPCEQLPEINLDRWQEHE